MHSLTSQIIQLLADGLNRQQIARHLGASNSYISRVIVEAREEAHANTDAHLIALRMESSTRDMEERIKQLEEELSTLKRLTALEANRLLRRSRHHDPTRPLPQNHKDAGTRTKMEGKGIPGSTARTRRQTTGNRHGPAKSGISKAEGQRPATDSAT